MYNIKFGSLFKLSLFNSFLILLIFTFFAGDAIASEYNILAGIKQVNIFALITSRTNYNDSVLYEPVENWSGCEDDSIQKGYSVTTTNIKNSCGTTESSTQLQSYSVEDVKWYDYNYHSTHDFCINDYRYWPLWGKSIKTGIYTDSGSDRNVAQSRDWQESIDISTEWTYETEPHPEMAGELKSAILTGEFWFPPGGVLMVNGLMPSIKHIQCPAPSKLTQPCGACFLSTYLYYTGMCQGTMEWDLTSQILSSNREIKIRFKGSGNPLILQDVRDCDDLPNWREEERDLSISVRDGPYLILTYKVESCEINLSISPSEVRPQKTGENTEAVITVLWSKQTPTEGCIVNLDAVPVDNSGGHSHVVSRPTGTLSESTVAIPGGITAGSKPAGTYTSSEISGQEKIIATVNGQKVGEVELDVMVLGFLELVGGDGYTLIGSTGSHPKNHFGTENTLYSLLDLASEFYENGNGTLRINDIRLIGGGAFDICGKWYVNATCTSAPNGGHKSHRIGKNVDVSNKSAEGKSVTKDSLKKIIKKLELIVTVRDEGNHFHLTFQ